MSTGLVSSVVLFLRSSSTPTQASIDSWQWGSRDRKLAALQETYNGIRTVIDHPRREEIESFLKEVTAPTEEGVEPKWLKAIDAVRFRNRLMSSPWVKSLSLIDQRDLMSQPIQNLSIEGPNQFQKIEIIRIVPWAQVGDKSSRADETLVFTFAHRGYRDYGPVLFWLRENEGQWKLVDWEIVDGGSSESESAGLWEFVSHDKLDPSCRQCHNYLNRADALKYQDEDEYEKLLRLAEGCRVPAPVEDLMRYKILNRWNNRSRHDEVRRLAKQVQTPERIPGVLVVHAIACESSGETDEALALVDRLEHLIGFRPDTAEMRAQLLTQSNRREEAIAEWQRLADFDPEKVMYLGQLYRLMPKSERIQVVELIKQRKDPGPLALQFAWYNSHYADSATLQELSQFVKKTAPDSAEAQELEIIRLRKALQYHAAAALYREAAERETEPEDQLYQWGNYLREMRLAGELLAGFAELPDQKSILRQLVTASDDDELEFPVNDLIPLLAAYREREPDDPWLLYGEGYVAQEQHRFADANNSFAESERLVSEKMRTKNEPPPEKPDDEAADPDNLEQLISLNRYQRCRARYELGEDVDVLIDYHHEPAAYQVLASLAMQYEHWPVIQRLNRAYATRKPDDEWLLFYEAHASLGMKDLAAVRKTLQIMVRRESQNPNLKYWREQLERELFEADHPDPIDAYLQSQDHATAFTQVSRKLLVQRDWKALDKLCEQASAGRNNPSVDLVRLEMAWRKSDDAQVAELLTPWPTATIARQSYLESTWRERLVDSLLRLQRWDEALASAQAAKQRHDEAWPLIKTYIARQNSDGIAQLLADDESLPEVWAGRDFAASSLLRPMLLEDAFADFRQHHQFRMPNYQAGESLVLLLREPMELSESWLQDKLTDPAAAAQSAPTISRISPTTFVIHWKGVRFAVTTVSEAYFKAEFLTSRSFTNRPHEDMDSMFNRQTAYLRLISLLADDPQPWDSPSPTVRELGAKLLTPDVIGAIHRTIIPGRDHVAMLHDGQSDLLASRVPFPQLGISTMTLRADPATQQLPSVKREALEKLAARVQPLDPSARLKIDIQLCDWDIPMTVPFQLQEVRRERYGSYLLVVEYAGKEHVPGFPELHSGVRYLVDLDYVADVNVTAE